MGVLTILFIHAAVTYTFARLVESERRTIIFTWINVGAACLLGNPIFIGVDVAAVFGGAVVGRVHREEALLRRPSPGTPVAAANPRPHPVPVTAPQPAARSVAAAGAVVLQPPIGSSIGPGWIGFMSTAVIVSLIAWAVSGIYLLEDGQSSLGFAAGQVAAFGVPSGLTVFLLALVLSPFPVMRKLRGWLVIAIAYGLVLFNQAQGVKATKHYTEGDAVYMEALSMYERNYPAINPDSPSFDEKVTVAVADRMDYYMASGRSKQQALHLAIRDTFFTQASPVDESKARLAEEKTKAEIESDRAFQERRRAEEARNSELARRTDGGQVRDGSNVESGVECEYKAVMTQEDFTACGISPEGVFSQ